MRRTAVAAADVEEGAPAGWGRGNASRGRRQADLGKWHGGVPLKLVLKFLVWRGKERDMKERRGGEIYEEGGKGEGFRGREDISSSSKEDKEFA